MSEKDKTNVSKTTSLGIDGGGTKTRLVLLDGNLEVLEDIKIKTPKAKQEFGEELTKPVRKFLKRSKEEDLKISAVGVGFAGTVDHDKAAIKSAPNLPDLVGLSFRELLQDLCKCEVAALNDVHAALYGEIKVGKAAACKDAIAIFYRHRNRRRRCNWWETAFRIFRRSREHRSLPVARLRTACGIR